MGGQRLLLRVRGKPCGGKARVHQQAISLVLGDVLAGDEFGGDIRAVGDRRGGDAGRGQQRVQHRLQVGPGVARKPLDGGDARLRVGVEADGQQPFQPRLAGGERRIGVGRGGAQGGKVRRVGTAGDGVQRGGAARGLGVVQLELHQRRADHAAHARVGPEHAHLARNRRARDGIQRLVAPDDHEAVACKAEAPVGPGFQHGAGLRTRRGQGLDHRGDGLARRPLDLVAVGVQDRGQVLREGRRGQQHQQRKKKMAHDPCNRRKGGTGRRGAAPEGLVQ